MKLCWRSVPCAVDVNGIYVGDQSGVKPCCANFSCTSDVNWIYIVDRSSGKLCWENLGTTNDANCIYIVDQSGVKVVGQILAAQMMSTVPRHIVDQSDVKALLGRPWPLK